MARSDLAAWNQGHVSALRRRTGSRSHHGAADRLLICGRCAARWRFEQLTCPFCLNADRGRITSFASRDGQYRLYACDVCERYLKAYDARRASRPVMPVVDSVATLPLDAAAIQKGYPVARRYCALAGPSGSRSVVFCESQLNRCRVSQNRPGFDLAPSTTTATC